MKNNEGYTDCKKMAKELNCNPIEDLNNMIAKMSTVIVCSESDKKKLEE